MTGIKGQLRRVGLTLVTAVCMVSCAAFGDRPPAEQPAPVESISTAPVEDHPASALPKQLLTDDMMFDILLGEIAGQRGDMAVSVSSYLQAAEQARDPRVAERAMQVASFARQYDQALQAAQRWTALDPDNEDAHRSLLAIALQVGDLPLVVEQVEYLLSVAEDPLEGYRMATAALSRHADSMAALEAGQQLLERRPDSPHANIMVARLALAAERQDQALTAIDRAIALDPGITEAYIIKAQILVRQDLNPEATALLKTAVEGNPDDITLRFAYGRMLLDAEDVEGAKIQFARVVALRPDFADGVYSLALLELETGEFAKGEKHLKQLLELGEHTENAHYYLGYAALQQGREDDAIDWYRKVDSGTYWGQSRLQVATILLERGDVQAMHEYMQEQRKDYAEQDISLYLLEGQVLTKARLHQSAYDLYSEALQSAPDDEDLLYARALAAEKLDRLDVTERDLQKILARDPDNVRSLNALGYTLADRTQRYEEALGYIVRAYQKEPNDPAIIDSMGWVHYRLGKLDMAREYLEKAWAVEYDSEIGAHFGEVMWMLGEHDEARRIWEVSRESRPDNPVLLEVINRLNP